MNKHLIRLVIFLISALLAIMLELIQIHTQPPVYEDEPRIVQEADPLDLSKAELTNAKYDKETLKTDGDGTVILFRFTPAKTVSHLTIVSKKHIHSSFPIRVSWSKDGSTFPDADSTEIQAVPESLVWTTVIPEGDYTALKVELNNKLTIRSINCRDEITEKVPIPEPMHWWRIGMLIPILFLILMTLRWFHAWSRFASAMRSLIAFLKKARWRTPLHILIFFSISFTAYVIIRWLISGSFFGSVIVPQHLFCILSALAAGCLLSFPKTLGAKPERLFVAFCLLSGWLILYLYPNNANINWDSEYHFEQAHLYSYLGEERLTFPDISFINVENSHDSFIWENRLASQSVQEDLAANGAILIERKGLMLNSIYEFFPVTGIFIARVLHLPWAWSMYFGKLFNLLTVCVCGFFAIRRLKSGKMILACVLLIPTNIFLASVFSYDHGVTSFLALGLSFWFAEWQEPQKKLTYRHAFVILGSFTFALLTKAFYGPLLFLAAVMPRGKWAKNREEKREFISRRFFLFCACMALLISLLPYALPLLQGNVVTDMRGGSSVAPMKQIHFILDDPIRFFRILFRFQGKYLDPTRNGSLLTEFSYQGTGPGWQILCILLVLAAITDKKPCDRTLMHRPHIRLWGLILQYLSVCIICFCLYITFTPTGRNTIFGVQGRYLLPFVFPVLMLLGSGFVSKLLNINCAWKQRLYNGLFFLASLTILFSVIYVNCVSKFR